MGRHERLARATSTPRGTVCIEFQRSSSRRANTKFTGWRARRSICGSNSRSTPPAIRLGTRPIIAAAWLANHTPPSSVLFVPADKAARRQAAGVPGQLCQRRNRRPGLGRSRRPQTGRRRLGRRQLDRRGAVGPRFGSARHAGVHGYAASAFEGELRLTALTKNGDRPVLKYKFPGGKEACDVTGLAVHDGVAVCSLPKQKQLLLIDAKVDVQSGAANGKILRPRPATIRADWRSPPTGNCWRWSASSCSDFVCHERREKRCSAAVARNPDLAPGSRRSAAARARRRRQHLHQRSRPQPSGQSLHRRRQTAADDRHGRRAESGPLRSPAHEQPERPGDRLARIICGSPKPISSRSASAFGHWMASSSTPSMARANTAAAASSIRSTRRGSTITAWSFSSIGTAARQNWSTCSIAPVRRICSCPTAMATARHELPLYFERPQIFRQLLQQQSDQRRGHRHDLAAARRRGRAGRGARPGQRLESAQDRRIQIARGPPAWTRKGNPWKTRRCSSGRT